MNQTQRREIILGNLWGMLKLRYALHGLSQKAEDPSFNVVDAEEWGRMNTLDRAEISTLQETIKFVEAVPVKKLIVLPHERGGN